MNLLFFIAVAIISGFFGGKIAQRLKLPGVVGYLVAGLIFGPSFLNVFHEEFVEGMNIFASFALSLVAFIIGSEMKLSTLKEMGTGVGLITILESFGAFLLVTAGVYFLTDKLYLALVFGAMAPASAPAGTVAVLQECKAKGRLTNALYTVVGLDDGLAIMIFAVAVAMARLLLVGDKLSVGNFLTGPIFEIIVSIAIGCAAGAIAGYFMQRLSSDDAILAICLGSILLCTGIAIYFDLSLILANLSLGMIHVNLYPAGNRRAYRAIESLTLPVYIIFFFLAGAHLQISLLPSMGLLGLVYVLCRISGLVGGAFLGGVLSKQSPVIRKYLGMGILCQAGVAIGLSLLAAGQFRPLGEAGRNLAIVVVNTIAATTIIFEIIGPIGTRIAITKAGEFGLNITEDDLIKTYEVQDVMDTKLPVLSAGTPLSEVIRIVSNTDDFYYPVVDSKNQIIGTVTLDSIRKTFATQELNDWLVTLDIAEPIVAKVTPHMPLSEALEETRRLDVEHLPVVASNEDDRLVGILNYRAVRRSLSAEVLSRQQEADKLHSG
jgi:Kef-type K+ transport system membrane component KefB/predicted transcriptional regulator